MTVEASLHELTLSQAARAVRARDVSPVELMQALLERAQSVDPHVQAWVTLDAERALAAARAAEEQLAQGGRLGPLHGVPFGAKDIFDTADLVTGAGFRAVQQPTAEPRCRGRGPTQERRGRPCRARW